MEMTNWNDVPRTLVGISKNKMAGLERWAL